MAILSVKKDSISLHNEKVPHEIVGRILQSIPSHVETSSLIKESGGTYNKSLLNATDTCKKNYHNGFEKAINLGIYGTDLGYVSIYKQNNDAMAYLTCIQSLAEELKIEQFFDYNTFKRLASNTHNMDSLLYLTITNFENINNFLYQQKRSEQSALILTGGWLEALYISCQVAKENKNERLKEKIAEQKIVLDQLIVLLSNYLDDENIKVLDADLKKLQTVYSNIKVINKYKESVMEEINGVYVMNDKSESSIEVTDVQIEEIGRITESIRKNIII